MVRQADKDEQRERASGEAGQELSRRRIVIALRQGEHAAVEMVAREAVHNGLRRGVDRGLRKLRKQRRECFDAFFREKDRIDRKTPSADQLFERNHALDDEAPRAAIEVAVLQHAIGRNAQIVGGGDRDKHSGL